MVALGCAHDQGMGRGSACGGRIAMRWSTSGPNQWSPPALPLRRRVPVNPGRRAGDAMPRARRPLWACLAPGHRRSPAANPTRMESLPRRVGSRLKRRCDPPARVAPRQAPPTPVHESPRPTEVPSHRYLPTKIRGFASAGSMASRLCLETGRLKAASWPRKAWLQWGDSFEAPLLKYVSQSF
jgi:hypothetical protein